MFYECKYSYFSAIEQEKSILFAFFLRLSFFFQLKVVPLHRFFRVMAN